MCDFSPDMPQIPATQAPAAPRGVPRLIIPTSNSIIGQNPDGSPIRRKTGLSALRIDRPETGLNISTET